jgi:hypothetical protein
MKPTVSKLLHYLSGIIGFVGVLALIGAWIAGDGTFLGLARERLYFDAIAISLVGIGYRLGSIIHFWEEQKGAGKI